MQKCQTKRILIFKIDSENDLFLHRPGLRADVKFFTRPTVVDPIEVPIYSPMHAL